MRFLLDENTEFRIARFLQAEGHDVTAIAHDYPHALADTEVLRIAEIEQRILITNDRDFGELIFMNRLPHAGVIYLRLRLSTTADDKITRLREVLGKHSKELDQFLVVTERTVRVRRYRKGWSDR